MHAVQSHDPLARKLQATQEDRPQSDGSTGKTRARCAPAHHARLVKSERCRVMVINGHTEFGMALLDAMHASSSLRTGTSFHDLPNRPLPSCLAEQQSTVLVGPCRDCVLGDLVVQWPFTQP